MLQPNPWFNIDTTCSNTHGHNTDVVVIGAGLAGASITWSLDQAGWRVTLVDSDANPAARASGNQRAVFKPHLNRNNELINAFYEQAFSNTTERLNALDRIQHKVERNHLGVLQLLTNDGKWPEFSSADPVSAKQASQLSGIPIASPALYFPDGGWVNSYSYCEALVNSCERVRFQPHTHISQLEQTPEGWRLHYSTTSPSQTHTKTHTKTHTAPNAQPFIDTPRVIIATGPATERLMKTLYPDLPLTLTTSVGQTTLCTYRQEKHRPQVVISARRYLIPESRQCTIGATHWRHQTNTDAVTADDCDNLSSLSHINKNLHTNLIASGSWRELRASTADRLPLVGPVPDIDFYQQAYKNLKHGPKHQTFAQARYINGLYLFSGLGSRGLVSAALCADLLSACINPGNQARSAKQNQFLPYLPLVHPARFLIRQLTKHAS